MDPTAVRERADALPTDPGVYQFLARIGGSDGGVAGPQGDDRGSDDGSGVESENGNGVDVEDGNGVDVEDGNGVDGASGSGGDERVLYIGKAVDLRDRVRSYADHRGGDAASSRANGEAVSGPRGQRIRRMVAEADRIDYAVTDTETQALLLEANLIKRHRPRYNVRLKDDKSYPLVQLTDHEFPRIEITRDPEAGATVFGPFTDKGRLETVVKAVRETDGLRGCSDHKFANRDRPCLDYDIGLCSGPCVADTDVDRETYLDDVEAAERFFEGETGALADPLRRAMNGAATEQEFERAANLRDRLDAVESLHGESGTAVAEGPQAGVDADPAAGRAVDVLGVAVEGGSATVARLHSEDGKLVDRDRHRLDAPEGETAGDVLAAFVTQYYAERDLPDAILCSDRPDDPDLAAWLAGEGVDLRTPGAGREATLIDLALKNARSRDRRTDESAILADALGLDARVTRIEGFDVSHAQGKVAVGSDVAFVDGDPEKSGYRRKKLDDRNDDYANVRALVRWRAERAVEGRDDRPDPDLLLIDGGEGQLGAARDALEAAGWDVPAVALAKDEELVVTPAGGPASSSSGTSSRAERSYGIFDWDDDAAHLHLLQRVRDEAHRFAVQYHRTVRDDVSTVLDDVDGIGPETRKRLLGRFGSVENVRAASPEELRSVDGIGERTAETLADRL